jgi:DNA-binding NarL/FixJ family response regulator
MTAVMVVEDDPAFLTRFVRIVATAPELTLLAAVSDLASARRQLARQAPDVLLTDLGLPDGSGIDLIRETAKAHPLTDTMVITVFGDEEHVLASIEAGATGYILKDSLPEEFVALIAQLRAGGSPISPVIARQLLKRFKPKGRRRCRSRLRRRVPRPQRRRARRATTARPACRRANRKCSV